MTITVSLLFFLLARLGFSGTESHLIELGMIDPPLPTPVVQAWPVESGEDSPCYEYIVQYDWPISEAVDVMMCESRGNPSAVSYAGAVGCFQIHPYNEINFDPATNVAAAYAKWLDGGRDFYKHWGAWGTCGR